MLTEPAAPTRTRVNAAFAAQGIGEFAFAPLTSSVFVVDDDESVRKSLARLIGRAGLHVETFASAQDFLSRRRASVPCCLVAEMRLPGISGLQLQQQLTDRIEMPIIFLTGHGDVATTVRAMKAGAVEVLTKPVQKGALLIAVRHAIDRGRAAQRRESEVQTVRRCYATLTSRQRDVMRLVVAGLLNKEVGQKLGISEITVKAHRGNVMRKMDANTLPDLVTKAARLDANTEERS